MPKLNGHVIVYNKSGEAFVATNKGEKIGSVDEILKSEELCKKIVHPATEAVKLPSNFDPDWEGWATIYGYRHYVSDGMQSAMMKGFYICDYTAKESFMSFLKVMKIK